MQVSYEEAKAVVEAIQRKIVAIDVDSEVDPQEFRDFMLLLRLSLRGNVGRSAPVIDGHLDKIVLHVSAVQNSNGQLPLDLPFVRAHMEQILLYAKRGLGIKTN